jgi:hypothetical protein
MRPFLAAGLAAALAAGSAGAKTVYVANDGLDGDGCGTKSAPCRSITSGIAAAAANDTILVGPGRYGDLNDDGVLGGTGEESGTNGVVDVNKAVRVYSTDGADATVIQFPGLVGVFSAYVLVFADDAAFGRRNGGFTIAGHGEGTGISGLGLRVSIQGNAVYHTAYGVITEGAGSDVSDNRIALCFRGILLGGAGASASRNALLANELGLDLRAADSVVDANVAVSNATGIDADAANATLRRMLVAGNRLGGGTLSGTGLRIEASSFLANGDAWMDPGCAFTTASSIDATGNYWGSPLGPGLDNPADRPCGAGADVEPFLKKGKTPKRKPTR